MTGLVVVDVLTPKPGLLDEVRERLVSLAASEFAAAAPYGAVSFSLREEDAGGRLMLEELWRDRAAFDAFHAGPDRPRELLDFLADADRLLAEPIASSVSFWRPLEELR